MNCKPLVQSFHQAEQTIIMVSAELRDRICNVPTVNVYQLNAAGKYELANIQVTLTGMPLTMITIDHGGRASGFIKIQ